MQASGALMENYQVIALSPWSVQEMYDLTIRAFNSERAVSGSRHHAIR